MSPLNYGESDSIRRGFVLARLRNVNEDKGDCFNGSFQVIYESNKEPDDAELLIIPQIVKSFLESDPEDELFLLFAPGVLGGFKLDDKGSPNI